MTVFRRGRFLFWLARELSQKYTRALLFGIIMGFGFVLGLKIVYPTLRGYLFVKTVRVGIVGEYTPSTLPDSILSRLSTGLTTIAPNGSASAGLAENWEATDSGKRYVFHLRTDAVFHNGKKVTASDVNYNINGVIFTATDPHTLTANLNSAYSPFPTLLAKPILTSGLVGFGDYKVASVRLKADKIQSIRLVPVNSRIHSAYEYRFYRTQAATVLAYELGEIDVIDMLDVPDKSLTGWNNTLIESNTRKNRIVTVYFDLTDPMLKDKSIRQGLAYGIPDLPGVEKAISPVSTDSWAYTDAVKKYSFDAKQAKKLLDVTKSGTESAQLTIHTFAPYLDTAQAISASWNSLGLKTEVRVVNEVPDNFQVLVSAHDLSPDPDQYVLWHSTQTATNITSYANAKIDKLLEDGRQELDQEKRIKIYQDFQKRLVDDVPAVFLYYPKTYRIRRK